MWLKANSISSLKCSPNFIIWTCSEDKNNELKNKIFFCPLYLPDIYNTLLYLELLLLQPLNHLVWTFANSYVCIWPHRWSTYVVYTSKTRWATNMLNNFLSYQATVSPGLALDNASISLIFLQTSPPSPLKNLSTFSHVPCAKVLATSAITEHVGKRDSALLTSYNKEIRLLECCLCF